MDSMTTATEAVDIAGTYDKRRPVDDWPANTTNGSYTEWDICAGSPDCGVGWVLSRVVPVVFCVIAVFGFVGNLAVVAAIVSDHRLRTTTNTIVLSLALADLLFIIVCVPFTALLYSATEWTLGVAWCKLYQYLINVTAYASVYTLVRALLNICILLAISVDKDASILSTTKLDSLLQHIDINTYKIVYAKICICHTMADTHKGKKIKKKSKKRRKRNGTTSMYRRLNGKIVYQNGSR